MDTKKVTIGVFVATTLVFGVLAFKTPTVVTVPEVTQLGNSAPVVNVPAPVVNVEAAKVTVPAPIVNVNVPKQETRLGALTGPDIYSPYLNINGVTKFYSSGSFTAATTTPCSLQSPSSTSTLMFAGWQITVGTSTAASIDLGTSTTRYATTTNKVAAKSVAAGAQGYAVWTPAGGGVDDNIMSPSTWVVVKTAGSGLSGYTYTGTCEAVFQTL